MSFLQLLSGVAKIADMCAILSDGNLVSRNVMDNSLDKMLDRRGLVIYLERVDR